MGKSNFPTLPQSAVEFRFPMALLSSCARRMAKSIRWRICRGGSPSIVGRRNWSRAQASYVDEVEALERLSGKLSHRLGVNHSCDRSVLASQSVNFSVNGRSSHSAKVISRER